MSTKRKICSLGNKIYKKFNSVSTVKHGYSEHT